MSDPVSTLNQATAHIGQSIRIEDLGSVGQVTLRGDLTSRVLKKAARSMNG